MLPIHWSAQALDELDAIIGYIAQRSPSAAERMHALIEAAVLPLAYFDRGAPKIRRFS